MSIDNRSEVPFGFNVIAHASANWSLGITARHFIELFRSKGIPFAVLDIAANRDIQGRDQSAADYFVNKPDDLPYSINLICLSFWEFTHWLAAIPNERFSAPGRLNVAVPFWEAPDLPLVWVEALQSMDVVLGSSHFLTEAFANSLEDTHVISINYPLMLPKQAKVARHQFDIPDNALVFVTSADAFTSPARKNTFAVIDAFEQAFPSAPDVRLVIKLNIPSNAVHIRGALVNAMRKRAAANPRILVIADTLPYPEVLGLYSVCDVFVSLHRAEGLGMAPMEAMTHGKPVIATAWSGNMTYMNHSNSCPVSYRLIPPPKGAPKEFRPGFLRKKTIWAEPSITEAAHFMRLLHENPTLRSTLGKRAAADMAQFIADAWDARFVDGLRLLLLANATDDEHKAGKLAALQRMKKSLRSSPGVLWLRAHQFLDDYVWWRIPGLK